MRGDPTFAPLLGRTLVGVGVCAALVAACYFFVDRPVALFIHARGWDKLPELDWLTYPPPDLQLLVPVALVALGIRRAWGPLRRWERCLLVAGVALVLADQFKETLGIACGRDWPGTWVKDNPSLLKDGEYGFRPFAAGAWYNGSFPSGHTARVVAAAAVVWIAYPRLRGLCVLASLAVAVGLVGRNYHFVGDVIAGGFVGAVVGVYAAYFSGFDKDCGGLQLSGEALVVPNARASR